MKRNERTVAILAALQNHDKPAIIAEQFGISVQAVYQLAKRNGIEMLKLSETERKERIKQSIRDYQKRNPDIVQKCRDNEREKRQADRLRETIIFRPAIASRMKGTALLNTNWILKEGHRLDSKASNAAYSRKFGLKTLIGA